MAAQVFRCAVNNQISPELQGLTKIWRSKGVIYDQPRSDRGQPRALAPSALEALLKLRRLHPQLTVAALAQELLRQGILQPGAYSLSTLQRRLAEAGLDRRSLRAGAALITGPTKAFELPLPNLLWMADAMNGPTLKQADQPSQRTFLFALIDDHSRLCVHGQFYPSERTECFLDCLRQAIQARGLPDKLYTDNGPSFRNQHLQIVCAHREHGCTRRLGRNLQSRIEPDAMQRGRASLQAKPQRRELPVLSIEARLCAYLFRGPDLEEESRRIDRLRDTLDNEFAKRRNYSTIDTDKVNEFIRDAYKEAGLTADDVDTGAVIITGEALKKENAQPIVEAFAKYSGKFICAAAGHNHEALLAVQCVLLLRVTSRSSVVVRVVVVPHGASPAASTSGVKVALPRRAGKCQCEKCDQSVAEERVRQVAVFYSAAPLRQKYSVDRSYSAHTGQPPQRQPFGCGAHSVLPREQKRCWEAARMHSLYVGQPGPVFQSATAAPARSNLLIRGAPRKYPRVQIP